MGWRIGSKGSILPLHRVCLVSPDQPNLMERYVPMRRNQYPYTLTISWTRIYCDFGVAEELRTTEYTAS